MAQCRSCKAEILWATNPQTGRKVPIDEHPVTMFELHEREIESSGEPDIEILALPLQVYQSHFATCPDADKWRKERLPR